MIRLNKGTADFHALKWAITALDLKEKHNPTWRTVFVIAGKAYGTDGCRLHVAPVSDVEDGAYSVEKSNASEMLLLPADVQAPDFARVIPATGDSEPVDVEPTVTKYAALIRAMPEPFSLQYQYFLDAAAETSTCTVCPNGSAPILKFESPEGNIAVVMPVRA